MATHNSDNITAQGVAYYNGTGSFSGIDGSTSGKLLTSNGTGVAPSFQTFSGTFTVNVQTFTSSGTYTPTSGMKCRIIQCVGGGGGGAGAPSSSSSKGSKGGCGGAGEYAVGLFTSSDIGASKSVTIGAAGSAGSSGGNNGGNGGNTSVGALISANGGGGGTFYNNTAYAMGLPGTGGTGGSGGYFRAKGRGGGVGIAYAISTSVISFSSPGGAAGLGGGGGPPWIQRSTTSDGGAGLPATPNNTGAGGSGGFSIAGAAAQAGGAGAKGIVIVTEFII